MNIDPKMEAYFREALRRGISFHVCQISLTTDNEVALRIQPLALPENWQEQAQEFQKRLGLDIQERTRMAADELKMQKTYGDMGWGPKPAYTTPKPPIKKEPFPEVGEMTEYRSSLASMED